MENLFFGLLQLFFLVQLAISTFVSNEFRLYMLVDWLARQGTCILKEIMQNEYVFYYFSFLSFLFFFSFLLFTGKLSMSNQQTHGCDIDINCASIAFPLSSHPRGGALFYSTVSQWGFNHFRFLRDLIVESESWNAISWSLWGSLALEAVFSSSWDQRFVHLVSFQACLAGSQCLGGLVG